MARQFSTATRALLKFMWAGMSKDTEWETAARQCIEYNTKLPAIETAQIKSVMSLCLRMYQPVDRMFRGKPHKSNDPKEHVSMTLYDKDDVRVTSVHVYKDGTGKFSKSKYN